MADIRPETMERITTPELAKAFIDEQVEALRAQIGDGKVLLALSGGVDTDKVLACAKEISAEVDVPLVFMTYGNVVYHYGIERFAKRAAEAGICGVILPDVPYEEKAEFFGILAEEGIDLISMIAPTSEDRIAMIAREAEGFLYIVSSLGVTGVRSEITTDVGALAAMVKANTDVPCAIGFGISTPEQAERMAAKADGAIVGSAIIKIVAQHGRDAAGPVGEYVRAMKDAVRRA